MSLKIDLTRFNWKSYRSYARLNNGQEETLRSYLNYDFAIECFVRALETAPVRPDLLIGGVPIGESTDGQIVFQITCLQKTESGVECDDFFTAVCHRDYVEQFCSELEEQYQRCAEIYLPGADLKPTSPRPADCTTSAALESSAPTDCPFDALIARLAGAIRSK